MTLALFVKDQSKYHPQLETNQTLTIHKDKKE